jgi:DUF2892 family protein
MAQNIGGGYSSKATADTNSQLKGDSMTVERYLRLIAGCFVLASLLLGYIYSPLWFLLTGFVALNLIQSAFTNWCPMMTFLRWLGARDQALKI